MTHSKPNICAMNLEMSNLNVHHMCYELEISSLNVIQMENQNNIL